MKTIKLLLCLVAFSTISFYSCNDSDPIENNTPNTQQSIAMRTALNELKQANEGSRPAGRTLDNPFCFEFVYPLTFSYNNGTAVTVSSFGGLLELLLNETPNQYLTGIAFPFSVLHEGAVVSVDSEAEFTALLVECGFNTLNDDLEYTFCFDLVFPITINQNGQTIAIDTMEQFGAFLNSPSNGIVDIVFPITANYNGQSVTINNLYELYQMINNCDDCICSQEYAPVCVQTATGIQEFGNLCYAMCAGFTQNDLVPCNGGSDCSITNFTATTGNCDATGGTYQVTLDFDYTNASANTFEVSINGNSYGTHPLSALPITINVPQSLAAVSGQSWVAISGANCSANTGFAIPNCNCVCTTDYAPVCVQTNTGVYQYVNACNAYCAGFSQSDFVPCGPASSNFETLLATCFDISLPVSIQHQGQLITANDYGTILQYHFPNLNPIPAFNYPITVTFTSATGGFTVAVQNQAHFQELITTHCN